jgi:PKHD-type hydroxylase
MKLETQLAPRITTPRLFENVFQQDERSRVLQSGNAATGPSWWIGRDDTRKRSAWSTTISLNRETRWIFHRLKLVFAAANLEYQFETTSVAPELLFARYEAGDHFDWHIDLGEEAIADRKLSMAVLLNDPADFQGGNWQFAFDDETDAPKAAGAAVVFPSYLPHRVTPVTSGSRYSLVGWMCGPTFK